MNITINDSSHVVEIAIEGKIYVEEATVIREKLLTYIDKGYYNYELNFSKVSYIDSSGLGVLVAIQKKALTNGGSVAIKGLHGIVKELFELTRLTKVFTIIE